MRGQLLAKFIGNFKWIRAGVLMGSRVVAPTSYSQADTCRNPATPGVTGSVKSICRNEAVTLTAADCIGTVVWLNGKMGSTLKVGPQQTTTYTAICRTRPGCISLVSNGYLAASQQSHAWLMARLEVSWTNTLTFSHKAITTGVDVNCTLRRDRSINGTESDPDHNDNPADNDKPMPVTLRSLFPKEGKTGFTSESSSPNGDSINDKFIIQRLPIDQTAQTEVYNRWAHLVYRQSNYKNDWDGAANQGIRVAAKEALPDETHYYQIRLSDGREYVRFLTLAQWIFSNDFSANTFAE